MSRTGAEITETSDQSKAGEKKKISCKRTWLGKKLIRDQRGYDRCVGEDYAPLREFGWWNEAVESLTQEKEPSIIESWETMTERERAAYIADWSRNNGNVRPKVKGEKEKDFVQKVMASWLSNRLNKDHDRCMGEDSAPLRDFAWWNEAVAALQ